MIVLTISTRSSVSGLMRATINVKDVCDLTVFAIPSAPQLRRKGYGLPAGEAQAPAVLAVRNALSSMQLVRLPSSISTVWPVQTRC